MNNSLYSSEYSTALAVVGMAGRFPGANSLEQFWQNIANKVSSIRHYSDEELLAAGVKPEDIQQPNYVKAGTVLEHIEDFDTSFFGISPREAEVIDPQFRIFLECVWEALEMAGCDITTFGGLTGVFAGAGYKNYHRHHILPTRKISEALSEFQIGLGQEQDVLATLVSYKLNLKGPSVSVQSFCSTSLVAVHLACQSLLNYECDIAVAGGTALNSLQKKGYFYEEGQIISPDGTCRPFDAKAHGSVLSNGAAVVALKRLQDALDDGDPIHSIIRGSAMNNDGNQRVSYTSPGLDGQASVIASALSYAGIHPETIAYIEANGSSTLLGDAIELAAMTKAFAGKTQKKRFCAIGSLKSNVGHLDRASGVAGLIKTTLALSHRQLPPHIHYEQPNPEMDLSHSPFYVNTQLAPWPQRQGPRRAGINSFGLGGTNVHLVVEEAPERTSSVSVRPYQLLALSAKSEWSLQQANSNLIAHLKAHPEQSLADVAYTLQVGRCAFSYRQFVIARTTEEACTALEQQQVLSIHQERRDRGVAWLFAGTDEGCIELAHHLYRQEPHFRETVVKCCQLVQTRLHLDLQTRLFPELAEQANQLARVGQSKQSEMADLTIFVVEYALAQLLMEWNICPQAMLGDGLGEYVAACLAGVFSLEDALTLVTRRAQLVAEQSDRAMFESPLLEESRPLPLSEDACRSLSSLLQTINLHEPRFAYVSNVTGTWITKEQAMHPDYWVQQMCQAPLFAQGVELLLQDSRRVLLEVGPGQRLGSLVKQISACDPERSSQVITMQHTEPAALLLAVGDLWGAGVSIDWKRLYGHEQRLKVVLPTYPFERQRCWVDDPTNLNVIRQRIMVTQKEADIANWFYLPYWEASFPLVLPSGASRRQEEKLCLVFVDPSGMGSCVAQRLEQEGCSVISVEAGDAFVQCSESHFAIRPDVSADYTALFKELARRGDIPRTIIHCWSVTTDEEIPSHSEYVKARQKVGFSSLLCLARAIGSSVYDKAICLIVMSNHIHAVADQEFLRPEKAPILGVCKVVAQEYPSITCRNIDLGRVNATSWTNARLVENLVAECLSDAPEPVVAFRGHIRWLQRYIPVRLEQAERASSPFRSKGSYLIIGGLGEIGLILAEYLATKVQARIMLLDDSPFPRSDQWSTWLNDHPQNDPVSQIIQRVRAMEGAGAEVQVLEANLADAVQMKQAVDQVQQQFGALHGVLYLAGGSDLQTIQDIDQASYEAQFQPKLQGLFALEQAVQGIALDFCLLHSSLTGILGGLGSATDAAASVFMDVFALKKNQTSSTPWICVDWDSWQTRENEQQMLGTTIARFLIAPHEGVEALSRIIASRWPSVITSTGDLNARIQRWVQPRSEHMGHAEPVSLNTKRPPVSTEYVPPTSPTEQKIVEIWQLLLGFEQIGIDDNFFELHGHSLLGMQLISRLRQIFQVNVPLKTLFEEPTIANLAEVVEALIIEEIDQLDEEEARLLI